MAVGTSTTITPCVPDVSERHDAKRATMAATFEAETGRSVREWVTLLDDAGVEGFMAAVSG